MIFLIYFISLIADVDGKPTPYNSVQQSKDQKKTSVRYFSGTKSTFVISYSVCLILIPS
jgi:hypothetical protein